jgi:membrane fusion protein, multidrug efflux system
MIESKSLFSRFGSLNASHVIAVGLAVGTALWMLSGAVTGSAPSAEKAAKQVHEPAVLTLVRVRTSTAEQHQRTVTLFGRTEAVKNVDLAAETAGKVVDRPVKKGAWTKKGTPILKLAMDDRLSRLKEAEAKAEYQRLVYEAANKLSHKQFQSKLKVVEAKAAVVAAKAVLAKIRLDIRRTTVRAAIDGFIETLPASVGDYVKAGDVVATLVNLDPVRIVAQVSERQVTRLKIGDTAQALFPDGASRQGTVRYISRMGKSETRTFRVEVWLDNPGGAIPEGLTTELRLPMGVSQAHLVSPAMLTLDDKGVIGVKTVDADDRVKFYAVEIIEDTTVGVWLGGLPETITLITVGQEFVRDGQQVRTQDKAAVNKSGAENPS